MLEHFLLQADLKVQGPYCSTFAVFMDAGEADAAFSGFEGQATTFAVFMDAGEADAAFSGFEGQANMVCAENNELLANF